MGVTETARLGLVKPDDDESADIDVINSNMDTIDGAIGPSIVGTVAEIAEPYNGQVARELDNDRTLMFINGVWLYVAVGDANSSNPNRIVLPPNAINDIDDTTNAFQIGTDASDNLAFDQNSLQARNNGATDTLSLNKFGGQVEVGVSPGLTVEKAGIKSDEMQSAESSDGSNISVSSTSYTTGSPNVQADVNVPPSGRILVLLSARCNVQTSGETCFISYECTKLSGSGAATPVSPGLDSNTIQNKSHGANDYNDNSTTVIDMVKGLTPGSSYRFQVQHKKSGGTVNIDFRKIIALPVI